MIWIRTTLYMAWTQLKRQSSQKCKKKKGTGPRETPISHPFWQRTSPSRNLPVEIGPKTPRLRAQQQPRIKVFNSLSHLQPRPFQLHEASCQSKSQQNNLNMISTRESISRRLASKWPHMSRAIDNSLSRRKHIIWSSRMFTGKAISKRWTCSRCPTRARAKWPWARCTTEAGI